jgi:hypothetical protein
MFFFFPLAKTDVEISNQRHGGPLASLMCLDRLGNSHLQQAYEPRVLFCFVFFDVENVSISNN